MERREGPPAQEGSRRLWLRRARRVLLMVVLVVAAAVGGIAATRLWPVTAHTDYLSARIALTLTPSTSSTVHTPTVLGDIDLQFDGPVPAPGIEAQVQVREEVTDLLTQGQLDPAAFRPDPEQLRATINGALSEVAWKFAGGALTTTAVCSALWVLGRRRGSWGRAAVASAGATVLALALPGSAAYLTYRSDNLAEYRTTSLLSQFGEGTLFTDIRGQAVRAAPYVQNLLALSQALQQEFTPEEISDQVGARFLLISDIHGLDYYPLIEQIVESEDITAVIDMGDLVNFGRVEEGEVADIYDGIEALDVPYVFVRGNHGARSATDESLVRRLDQLDNVALVEPGDGQYVEVQVAGVRISGYNDVRFFAQQSADFAADQQAALDDYEAATEGFRPADIMITHEPYGAYRFDPAGVTVNGHMHTPTLKGPHIGVGSFTGGGLFNHFLFPEEEDEDTVGELPGQPYAFDILTMGQDCQVLSLTRYSYRNLVSGRPQYDDVSLVNGATIDPEPPQGRTCGGSAEVVLTPIGPATGDQDGAGAGSTQAP
ncbi:MAG: metallophosphoesterase family protein [Ornithinimicrobium sp.]|uniref:metallophosphoesterase family protein n=1 Tax=Ornithinimicrobium sp. TaxID=1977084 RepID=UPI003D9B62CF